MNKDTAHNATTQLGLSWDDKMLDDGTPLASIDIDELRIQIFMWRNEVSLETSREAMSDWECLKNSIYEAKQKALIFC